MGESRGRCILSRGSWKRAEVSICILENSEKGEERGMTSIHDLRRAMIGGRSSRYLHSTCEVQGVLVWGKEGAFWLESERVTKFKGEGGTGG